MVYGNDEVMDVCSARSRQLNNASFDIRGEMCKETKGSAQYKELERRYEEIQRELDKLHELSMRALVGYVSRGSFGGW
ncbi:MAG: hypothetical protein KJ718_00085 [Nanoarchaeota archaeon]|nr:hypothetical protein [Nanoarchaeota archaeon]MBU1050939.1 hypothetical protein [Nanoarchaeota archaeon]MBU1988198.1 hypothetical protein [Nanoarchaeota archaeon]